MSVSSPLPENILDWCIGSIDGLLIEISSPSKGLYFFTSTATFSGASVSSYSYQYLDGYHERVTSSKLSLQAISKKQTKTLISHSHCNAASIAPLTLTSQGNNVCNATQAHRRREKGKEEMTQTGGLILLDAIALHIKRNPLASPFLMCGRLSLISNIAKLEKMKFTCSHMAEKHANETKIFFEQEQCLQGFVMLEANNAVLQAEAECDALAEELNKEKTKWLCFMKNKH
jgi:hypothetical protein